jgi:hypothetical protein
VIAVADTIVVLPSKVSPSFAKSEQGIEFFKTTGDVAIEPALSTLLPPQLIKKAVRPKINNLEILSIISLHVV